MDWLVFAVGAGVAVLFAALVLRRAAPPPEPGAQVLAPSLLPLFGWVAILLGLLGLCGCGYLLFLASPWDGAPEIRAWEAACLRQQITRPGVPCGPKPVPAWRLDLLAMALSSFAGAITLLLLGAIGRAVAGQAEALARLRRDLDGRGH